MRHVSTALLLGLTLVVVVPAFGQSSRYAGLWEGTFAGGLGPQRIALSVRPRGPAEFTGAMYTDGSEMGPIESGRIRGDSLTFRVSGFELVAIEQGNRLAVDLTVRNGRTHHFDLQRTTADTTRVPAVGRVAHAVVREQPPETVYAAHAVPAGPVSSTADCLRRGTLFLVGGGPGQDDLNHRFVELAGGASARIVVIPTASIESSDSTELARFEAGAARGLGFGANVTVLHTTSRREADSETFVAPLRRATGVWILGGEGEWLLDSYLGTRTERELIALLDRGGVVGGTSAGALIWGSAQMRFRTSPDHPSVQPTSLENFVDDDRHGGIGLLRNVCVAPHYAQYHVDPVMRKLIGLHPGLLGIGIDEATALEVHGDVGRVRGRGVVTIYPDSSARVVLEAGGAYDLVKRSTL